MLMQGHIANLLQPYLDGALPPAEREQAAAHLAACALCREEHDLLAQARQLMAPLPSKDARAGFAATVALAARDKRVSPFAQWLRWSAGGLALAGAAAAAVVLVTPTQVQRHDEMVLAQRLELLEDMTVMQNQEALEDLEVVVELHTLEARP
jgi:anti-sigma factor RsiW